MEKFIRTTGGSIWQLGQDENYHKPNVANHVSRTSSAVEAASDDIYDLVRVGDLVRFENEDLGVREVVKENIVTDNKYISKYWRIDAIYTKVMENGLIKGYELQAAKIGGVWTVIK